MWKFAFSEIVCKRALFLQPNISNREYVARCSLGKRLTFGWMGCWWCYSSFFAVLFMGSVDVCWCLLMSPGKFHGVPSQAAQSSTFKDALLGTGDKTLVYLDADPWAGMMAPGGIGGLDWLSRLATGGHIICIYYMCLLFIYVCIYICVCIYIYIYYIGIYIYII